MDRYKFDQAFEILSILEDKQRFATLGLKCMEQNEYDYAVKAFHKAGDKENLNHIGDILFKEGKIEKALESYTLADNQEMISFIKQNFSS
ncbi:hypothetical protein HYT56_05305 [Candidatus Woesearchaeota archaeon]|nr:hypothetical protein [Candidatus Woesearchaeota archaeon]